MTVVTSSRDAGWGRSAELGASPWAGNATLPNGWITTNPTKPCWWVTASGGTAGAGDHALAGNSMYADHSTAAFTGPFAVGAYHHLALTVDGLTVTCRTLSPTHPEVSVSLVDDGSWGAALTGTQVGLRFEAETSYHPYIDDFLVEAP